MNPNMNEHRTTAEEGNRYKGAICSRRMLSKCLWAVQVIVSFSHYASDRVGRQIQSSPSVELAQRTRRHFASLTPFSIPSWTSYSIRSRTTHPSFDITCDVKYLTTISSKFRRPVIIRWSCLYCHSTSSNYIFATIDKALFCVCFMQIYCKYTYYCAVRFDNT